MGTFVNKRTLLIEDTWSSTTTTRNFFCVIQGRSSYNPRSYIVSLFPESRVSLKSFKGSVVTAGCCWTYTYAGMAHSDLTESFKTVVNTSHATHQEHLEILRKRQVEYHEKTVEIITNASTKS